MADLTFDQLSERDQKAKTPSPSQPVEGDIGWDEASTGRKGPSDLETAGKVFTDAIQDLPHDWQQNSWTYAGYRTAADYLADMKVEEEIMVLRKKIDNKTADKKDKDLLKKMESDQSQKRFIRGRKQQRQAAYPEKGITEEVKEGLTETWEGLKEKPLTVSATMVKLFAYDAPIFLTAAWGDLPGAMARVADIAVVAGRAARAGRVAARTGQAAEAVSGMSETAMGATKVGLQMTEGAALGATGEAAKSFQEEGRVNKGRVASATATMMVMDPLGRLGGRAIKKGYEALRPEKGEKGEAPKRKSQEEWEKEEKKTAEEWEKQSDQADERDTVKKAAQVDKAEISPNMETIDRIRQFDKALEEDDRRAQDAKSGTTKKDPEEAAGKEFRDSEEEHLQVRELIDDERDWGLYNTAVEDYEAVRPRAQEIHDGVEASKHASDEISEHFQRDGIPKDLVTDTEALKIINKPGFQRTAAEKVKLKKWQLQGMLVAGGVGMAWYMADKETREQMIGLAKAGGSVTAAGIIPGFVLKSPRIIRGLAREKGTPSQWTQDIAAQVNSGKHKGLAEELRYNEGMEILKNLSPFGEITKEQVATLLQNGIRLEERVLGTGKRWADVEAELIARRLDLERRYGRNWMATAPAEEWHSYQEAQKQEPTYERPVWAGTPMLNTPGGNNPKEFLIRVPGIGEAPGVQLHFPMHTEDLALHIRANERFDAEGNRVLFIEEMQSDWANAINKYKGRVKDAKEMVELLKASAESTKKFPVMHEGSLRRLKDQEETLKYHEDELAQLNKVLAPFPFVHSTEAWQSLGIRRMLRYAVDEGFDKIAFAGHETFEQRSGKEGWPKKNEEILRRTLKRIGETLGGKESEVSFNRGGERSIDTIVRAFTRRGYDISYHGDLPGKAVVRTKVPDRVVPHESIPESLKPMLKQFIEREGTDPVDPSTGRMSESSAHIPFKTFGMDLPVEVREKIGTGFHLFNREGGKMTADMAAFLAAAGIGGLIGANMDDEHPIRGAIAGMFAGMAVKGAAKFGAEKLTAAWRREGADERVRIKDLIGEHQHYVQRTFRELSQLIRKAIDKTHNLERRQAIAKALDGDKTVLLSKSEAEVLQEVREAFARFSAAAQELGIHEDARRHYLKKMFDLPGQNPTKLAEFFARLDKGEIGFAFLGEGKKSGLRPRTEDIAQIIGMYGESVSRAVSNKRMLNALKNEGRYVAEGTPIPLVVEAGTKNVPNKYVSIDQPMLRGQKVHPDIAPELNMMFDTKDPRGWLRALSMINTASKRIRVSLSLFHAMALTQAMIGAGVFAAAGWDPAKGGLAAIGLTLGRRLAKRTDIGTGTVALGTVGAGIGAALAEDPVSGAATGFATTLAAVAGVKVLQFAAGTHSIVKQIREGGAGDLVDDALRDGVRISFERQLPVVGDVHQDFYAGMQSLQGFIDHYVSPVAGKPIGMLNAVNHSIDNMMWGRLHASMKIQTYAQAKARLLKNNAKAHDKSPDIPLMSEERAGAIAADYTNSIYGGLNWVKLAEGIQAKWGRQIAASMTGPTGMRWLNIVQFAPDWTVATTQSALRAFDPRGIVWGRGTDAAQLANLHRGYLVRAALWTALMTEAITYSQTGQHIWETDDPTVAHFEDGATMQVSKHLWEGFHWLPREITEKVGLGKSGRGLQQELDKLGFLPREIAKQLAGVKRLSTDPNAYKSPASHFKDSGERIKSVAENFKPFSLPMDEQEVTRALWGAVGLPKYPPKQKKKKKTADDYVDDALKE